MRVTYNLKDGRILCILGRLTTEFDATPATKPDAVESRRYISGPTLYLLDDEPISQAEAEALLA